MKAYSMDLRTRVLAVCDAKEGTKRQIAERFKVSEDWVYKLLRQRRQRGTLEPQVHRRGRKAIFQGQSLEQLKEWVDQQPDRTLQELRELSGKSCSLMAVWRALKRLGARYKKKPSGPSNKTGQTFVKNAGRGASGSRRSTRDVSFSSMKAGLKRI